MNASNTRTAVITRVAALCAATAMTTLVIGSQLGLADHYTSDADAVLAAKRAAPLAHSSGNAAPQRRGT